MIVRPHPRPHFKLAIDGSYTSASRDLTTGALLPQPEGYGSGAPSGDYGASQRFYLRRPRDAASDVLRRLPLDRGESRALVKANAIAAGAIRTNVDRVVGTGLALVAAPDRSVLGWTEEQAAEWKAGVQREFSLWSDSAECDLWGQQNFYDLQRLVEGSSLESGDCFTLLPDGQATGTQPYRLRLQVLEADRCGNPDGKPDGAEFTAGVRRATSGAPAAYHIYDRHPGGTFVGSIAKHYAGQWIDRVGKTGRRRILHHFRALRPEQPRGVPYLTPITYLLEQLARYTEAEIEAAVESANLTLIIKSPQGTGLAPIAGLADAQAASAAPVLGLAPGAVLGLAPGEESELVNPLRPNANFEPFVLSIIKQIGVGLGVPFELLIKQFHASYSASKAALLDAWMRFRSERIWLARSFCQPVYETWLAEAVILGRVKAPGFFRDPLVRWAYSQAAWFGDSMGSINPKDEVAAYIAAIDARLTTRERAEWELFGTDWNTTFAGKAAEQRRLIAADLLPVPKAGAAAPPQPSDEPKPDESAAAVRELAAAVGASASATAALAAKPQAAPSVEVKLGDTHVHAGDLQNTVQLPDGLVNLEAQINTPAVTVEQGDTHVTVPEPVVHVHHAPQLPTRQRITRDADGEMTEIVTEPIAGPTTH